MNPDIDPRKIFDDPWRAPALREGEELLFDEPGRILNNVDFSSHYFRVVGGIGPLVLRVKHGAGEQSLVLGYAYRGIKEALAQLDSDGRYSLLYALHQTNRDTTENVAAATAFKYKQAFADGRLKKRKVRGQPEVKVWIEETQP